jgi:hypothetical protein
MTLSIRALGLYDAPVTSSDTEKAFDHSVIHVPDTANPWDKENQKNVFLAGQRLGYPKEKGSRLVFYHLDELKSKDEVVLKVSKGRSYKVRSRTSLRWAVATPGRPIPWLAETFSRWRPTHYRTWRIISSSELIASKGRQPLTRFRSAAGLKPPPTELHPPAGLQPPTELGSKEEAQVRTDPTTS